MSAGLKETTIDDFELLKPISRGAFGKVFLGRKKPNPSCSIVKPPTESEDIADGTGQQVCTCKVPHCSRRQLYAIKVVPKQETVHKNLTHHLVAERDALALTHSPFVITLFYSLQSKRHVFLVMEYAIGGDVASLLAAAGCLEVGMATMYAAEVALALTYLHSHNIVHRDLKPDNMVICRDGHLKLTDFGLSQLRRGPSKRRGLSLQEVLATPPSPSRKRANDFYTSATKRSRISLFRTPGQVMSLMRPLAFTPGDSLTPGISVQKRKGTVHRKNKAIGQGKNKVIAQGTRMVSTPYRGARYKITHKQPMQSGVTVLTQRLGMTDTSSDLTTNTQGITSLKPELKERCRVRWKLSPYSATPQQMSVGKENTFNKYTASAVGIKRSAEAQNLSSLNRSNDGEISHDFDQNCSHHELEYKPILHLSPPQSPIPHDEEDSCSELVNSKDGCFLDTETMETSQPAFQCPGSLLDFAKSLEHSLGEVEKLRELSIGPTDMSIAGHKLHTTGVREITLPPLQTTGFHEMTLPSLQTTGVREITLPSLQTTGFHEVTSPPCQDGQRNESRSRCGSWSAPDLQQLDSIDGCPSPCEEFQGHAATGASLSACFDYETRKESKFHEGMFHTPFQHHSNSPGPHSPFSKHTNNAAIPEKDQEHVGTDDRLLGTPDYLAPELVQHQPHGAPVDWWALGVCLFEFLTGVPPFNDSTPEEVFQNVLSSRIQWPEIEQNETSGKEAGTDMADDNMADQVRQQHSSDSVQDDASESGGSMTKEAKEAIQALLTFDPAKRAGFKEVKASKFFNGIPWEDIRKMTPAFIPQPDDDMDTGYFEPRNTARHLNVSDIHT